LGTKNLLFSITVNIDEYAMLMLDSNFCCIQWDLLLIQQFVHMHMLFNLVLYLIGLVQRWAYVSSFGYTLHRLTVLFCAKRRHLKTQPIRG
jgi:hypothetical protein